MEFGNANRYFGGNALYELDDPLKKYACKPCYDFQQLNSDYSPVPSLVSSIDLITSSLEKKLPFDFVSQYFSGKTKFLEFGVEDLFGLFF